MELILRYSVRAGCDFLRYLCSDNFEFDGINSVQSSVRFISGAATLRGHGSTYICIDITIISLFKSIAVTTYFDRRQPVVFLD